MRIRRGMAMLLALCLSPAGSGAYVSLNPVYRAGDGRVYVMEGQCGRFDFIDRG